MKKQYLLVALMLCCVACNSKKKAPLAELSPSDLFEKFRKQVVLIKNKSYFKVTFDNGTALYYTRLYESGFGDLTSYEEEAKENATEAYGTGFFIGKKGVIATNFHVVSGITGLLERTDFNGTLVHALQTSLTDLKEDISLNATRLKNLHPDDSVYLQALPQAYLSAAEDRKPGTINDADGDAEEAAEEPADTTAEYLHKRIDSLLTANSSMEELTTQHFKIEIVTVELSILLDASTKNGREFPCHLVSLSQDKNVDLAVIQTDSKEVPEGIGEFTDLTTENDDGHYGATMQETEVMKVTTPLYLIGYNYGPEIAATSDGIKVQLSKGEVTQESDQYRVLYSVPSLPGSSGSPVFNNKGKIVAINYSGYSVKENFNYGVLSSHLKYILDHEAITTLP